MERLDIVEYVKSSLGFPLVDVEIDISDAGPVDYAIERSMRLYNRFRPLERVNWFTTTPSVQRYDFDALNLPYGRGVEQVQAPVRGGNLWLAYESTLLGLPSNMIRLTYGRELSDFLAIYGEIEQIERATAREFDWQWRQETEGQDQHWILYLSPRPYDAKAIEYHYTENATLATIREVDESWMQDHVKAQLMVHLGRARSKWNNELSMDGSALLADGKAELQQLEDEIRKRRKPFLVPKQG